ncbi:MAG: methylmalonyl-CoA mutase [Planctomycetota bacterium]
MASQPSDRYEAWKHGVYDPALKKVPEREKEGFKTSSGIELPPVHAVEGQPLPGEYPYTRGILPTMYRSRLWTMRQYAGFSSVEESNERYRYLLSQGVTGLSVAFDLPTQIGFDSDDAKAAGEVGRVGVPISTLADMERLFQGIPLDKVSVSMTINATASILLAFMVAAAKKQGVDPKLLKGTVQNDILKEFMARGTQRFPVGPSMRLVTDLFAYCQSAVPEWNTISISGYHIREAGSTAVQEVAFTLGDGIAYVEAALKAGLKVDDFAPRLSFFFNAHNNLFEEVGKFRAARALWAKIMKERFKAKDPRSWQLRFHTQTAGSTLTAAQPDNNVVRVTLQALAAVLGGTQSLHTNARDEALALPSEDSARLALRTQQVIAHESGVADVVDPLGGAPHVEYLTATILKGAETLIATLDSMGGMVKAIEAGWPQAQIRHSAFRAQKAQDEGSQKVVGVNCYQVEEKPPEGLLKIDPQAEAQRVEKMRAWKSSRHAAQVKSALASLGEAAKGQDNVLPLMVAAAESGATLGEMASTLAGIFGEWKP